MTNEHIKTILVNGDRVPVAALTKEQLKHYTYLVFLGGIRVDAFNNLYKKGIK